MSHGIHRIPSQIEVGGVLFTDEEVTQLHDWFIESDSVFFSQTTIRQNLVLQKALACGAFRVAEQTLPGQSQLMLTELGKSLVRS